MTRVQIWLFNVFLVAGLVGIGSGVCDEFGAGWSKMVVGGILFFGTSWLLLRPGEPEKPKEPEKPE